MDTWRRIARGGGRRGPATDRGVTPVVAIVLLVAITLLLASVAGTFVLGLTDSEEPAPQASVGIAVDPDDDVIRLEHQAGETLHSDRTRIVWEINDTTYRSEPPDPGSNMSAGQSVAFTFDGSTDSTGAWTNYPSPGNRDIDESQVVTVTLYDTETNKRIYTETVAVVAVREDL